MHFTFQFPSVPDAAAQARATLDVFERILAPAVLEDLQLVVSELVTNSVQHGPQQPITLRIAVDPQGVVRGEVVDEGDGERARLEMTTEPTLDGGWGLYLVDKVANAWGVHPGSTHVWFELGPHRSRRR